ncbi:hypothetical protein BO86DRAFT_456300 [Aspergillus japonicus CBS 114.51]|uniref:Uncharacterized protein n=1 Tax=Aspergillus japonicus CBS 114.51 TaxID=1448312 RepID=A0A8T8X2F6_ASPJA|nr:hypothetical protein BO86DRAFT_456300 [Aspergillus japonicus CBS 114.51]RAH81812.1 hypothetical protein BO86DRAFT_456300 [Aspergillus japonicus CBS 114.51]
MTPTIDNLTGSWTLASTPTYSLCPSSPSLTRHQPTKTNHPPPPNPPRRARGKGPNYQDKSLSSDLDPILKLQGIPWLLRKTILFTPLTIQITHHTVTTNNASGRTTMHLTARQTSIKAANPPPDIRHFDWEVYEQENLLFGGIVCRNRYIRGDILVPALTEVGGSAGGGSGDGVVRPAVEVQSLLEDDLGQAVVRRFLRGEVEVDGCTLSEGFLVEEPVVGGLFGEEGQGDGEGIWGHVFDRKKDGGWCSEQVWGFEMIHGERLYTRRAVVTNSTGGYGLAQLVYRLVES